MIGSEFEDVLAAARAGQDTAVGVLWRDLHPPLLRYLRGLEPGAAEDVESETWLHAARDLHRFTGNEIEFRAWMFTIARHRLIDWRRMAARRPAVARDPADLPDTPTVTDAADEALAHLDTEAALTMLGMLAPDQAEVILLRVLGGLDVERVASIMGKRPGTVRVLQHRGLRRLAAVLERAATDTRGVTQ